MKLTYNIFDGITAYAQITHPFKGIEFDIFIDELIDVEQQTQSAFVVFKTRLGKYKHPIKVSADLVASNDETFIESICDMAHESFNEKYGFYEKEKEG